MEAIRKFLENFGKIKTDEKGQTVIEYILVIVLIALLLLFAFRESGVRSGVQTAAQNIAAQLTNTP
jgi:Flp pilus assembly pilin Flp